MSLIKVIPNLCGHNPEQTFFCDVQDAVDTFSIIQYWNF